MGDTPLVLSFPPGGTGVSSGADLDPANLANLRALRLTERILGDQSLVDILSACSPAQLEEFSFTIARDDPTSTNAGSTMAGNTIIEKLVMVGLAANLTALTVNTSQSDLFTVAWEHDRTTFRTVPTVAIFPCLRHLSVSADNIYFPSRYPRVLLHDRAAEEADDTPAPALTNTNTNTSNNRLVSFLPSGLETLEITGIYAIPADDIKELARACQDGLFPSLRKVTLEAGGVTIEGRVPYEFPRGDDEDDPYYAIGDFEQLAEVAVELGEVVNDEVMQLFAAAGVEYEFDQPEFFFDRFAADWDEYAGGEWTDAWDLWL